MATAIRNSMTDNSVKDNTNDAINGTEVDANPNALADILDGTTDIQLGGAGAMDFEAIRILETADATNAVQTAWTYEWNPADSGNMTDGSSGLGMVFKMPDDADAQNDFARINIICLSDAAGAEVARMDFYLSDGSGAPVSQMQLTNGALVPTTTDDISLGTSSLNFSDLFLDSGAVVNFDSGDVTLTHAAGKLTFGGDGAVELDFNNHEMTNVDINSGAIDGTIIGGASVAAGSFAAVVGTTITGSGVLSIDDTTDTTSGTDGSIHTDGGLGIAKALWVATTSRFVGVTTHGGNVVSDADSTDDLGTTGVRWANLFVDDVTLTTTLTAGTSLIAGTLTLAGGSITDSSGAISFVNENLATTGTLASGVLTHTGGVIASNAAGPQIVDEAATATNPTLVPNKAELDTGFGWGAADTLTAVTGGAERMRIDSAGKVGIGTNSPAYKLDLITVTTNVQTPDMRIGNRLDNAATKTAVIVMPHETIAEEPVALLYGQSDSGSSQVWIGGGYSAANAIELFSVYTATDHTTTTGTERLRVDAAGDTFTNDGSISTLSDPRAKKEVASFSDGLSVVKKLNPINYKFNGMYPMAPDDGVIYMGFDALEVSKVAPYLCKQKVERVYENAEVVRTDTVWTLSQVRMIPILVNAIKELSAEIDILKAA